MSVSVTIPTGFKSEFSPVKTSVTLVFCSATEEVSGRKTSISALNLPASVKRHIPAMSDIVDVAVAELDSAKEVVSSVLTKACDGTYYVSIKADLWVAYEAFVQAIAPVLRNMKDKSIMAIVAMVERAFHTASEFEGE